MIDEVLLDYAHRQRKARGQYAAVKRWHGTRGGSVRKKVVCYVCDRVIDTYSANWAVPKHVATALAAHAMTHLCKACQLPPDQHADGKCLFEPTNLEL